MQCDNITAIDKVLFFPLIALSHRVIASRLCERTFIYFNGVFALHAQRSSVKQSLFFLVSDGLGGGGQVSEQKKAGTLDNVIKLFLFFFIFILFFFFFAKLQIRHFVSWPIYYSVLMFPLIALTHRVIALRLCESTFRHHFQIAGHF